MADLWKMLHERALDFRGDNDAEFLRNFANKIPRYVQGCSCKEFWRNWIRSNPPVYGKNAEYFAWTVKAHNAVNKKINKPEYTVEQARKFYQK